MDARQVTYRVTIFFFACLLFVKIGNTETLEKKTVRMNMGYYFNSISDVASRSDVEVSLNFWVKDLFAKEADKQEFNITSSKAILYDRIEDMQAAFSKGELDLVIAPPLLIAKYFKRYELADGFIGLYEGRKYEKLILIAGSDKNINDIKGIRGKRLGMIEDELADVFLDTLVLKEFKQSFKNIASSVQYQKKNNHLILDIYFGKMDAGVVYLSSYDIMGELNPDIKNKITVLAELPIKAKNFSFFRHDYPLKEDMAKVAMGFPISPRGKLILEIFKTPEVDLIKVEDLDVFDQWYKEYLQLKSRKKK
jgi:hypothetical protein